jgi:EAL domain-containing protein (putative c-di-GMP-specific phosphodiesterase class I)/GGDEF domain-containing protein/DNA-binding NarL/FixJ family response regulator
MAKQSSINILLVNKSEDESERLVTMFRNAGRIARIFRVGSAEELLAALKDKDWDLLISDNKHPEISTEQALEQLQKQQADLPLIALTDNPEEAQQALENGAVDVVAHDDALRLTTAAFREIKHLNQLRQLHEVEQKLAETEQRASLLLAESSTGIAYVADGMLISCNENFCQSFGYTDLDDMDCLPVIDLIADADEDKFKSLLKAQPSRKTDSTDCALTGVLQNGETFAVNVQLSNTIVDDENCIQISVHEGVHLPASANTEPSIPDITGYTHFISQLENAISQAQASQTPSQLLFVGLDQFLQQRDQHGLSQVAQLAQEASAVIKTECSNAQAMSQICDDGFTLLLSNTEADQALSQAQNLCRTLADQRFDSCPNLSASLSISVMAIDGSITETDSLLDHAFRGCHELGNNSAAIYAPPKSRKALGDAQNDDELDTVLEEALEDDQFWLAFQPLINIRGASGDHYEVKTRMTDKDGNEVIASDFLQSLNFKDTNTRLDRWILLQATRRLSEQGNNDVRLLINLTPHALHDDSLMSWLNVALKAGDFKPESLVLQFQEQDLVNHLAAAEQFAESLKNNGCQLSVSSFGNCDKPIKILNTLKPNYVRVHRNYTEQLQNGGDAQPLKALIASISEQGCKTVITAVDNASVMAQLWQLGVDFIQGNYLAPSSQEMDYEFTDIA